MAYGAPNAQAPDADLSAIAALTPSNDDFLQRKASAWTNRTVAQVKTDLSLSGSNTGDQTATTTPNTPAGGIAATTVQGAINELDTEKQAALGFTAENVANKATDFSTVNNTLYPTTQAVNERIDVVGATFQLAVLPVVSSGDATVTPPDADSGIAYYLTGANPTFDLTNITTVGWHCVVSFSTDTTGAIDAGTGRTVAGLQFDGVGIILLAPTQSAFAYRYAEYAITCIATNTFRINGVLNGE